ncbi:YvcK family protein [Jeotgalibaca sp. MA1X17-3]|uniref:gluconeogenesis factor YvcK family protein n=1 Tax=Jeotgalibaca sp. MA1X17-3 TaxID=2908211 RepID=UPI001F31F34B|nr:YvcK family protein [Jeotgalibaca sp. MA1X17-3]UJF15473.1 YvcK family protein [Jeotgalibaca sp. MA1X17-3]
MNEKPKKRQKKMVVLGGGTGLPVILNQLKKLNVDLTAIVTVADDGGSSGILRDYVNIVPPGDIRNCMIALSDLPQIQKDIFQYRFDSKDDFLSGHAIGNLIIAALAEMKGNVFDAVNTLSEMMNVSGKIYAAAEEPLMLFAEFEDGEVVKGESKIAQFRKKIERVYVKPLDDETRESQAARDVIRSIMEADIVLLGPGSLYTSILPNLMIPDLGQAIIDTEAEVVYICNIMTQLGETENFSDAEHVKVLHKHLNTKFINTVLVNTEKVPEQYLNQQADEEYLFQVTHDFQSLRDENCRVISADFLNLKEGGVYHDGEKVTNEILNLTSSMWNVKTTFSETSF